MMLEYKLEETFICSVGEGGIVAQPQFRSRRRAVALASASSPLFVRTRASVAERIRCLFLITRILLRKEKHGFILLGEQTWR
jgi:hypothetical protein